MTEAQIQKDIIEYIRATGRICERVNAGKVRVRGGYMKNADAGFPDIIVCDKGGQFVGIEVKKADGIQSKAQKDYEKRIKRSGGAYIVARSIDDIINLFD